MLVVGLTGGIGGGKTEVSRRFARLGVPVVDTDVIARELVTPGAPVLKKIASVFGDDMLTADGTLDRRRLREVVFADNEKRHRLEDILHPRIRDLVAERLAELQAPYTVIVIPLLLETRYPIPVDRVLVVDVTEKRQIERVMARDDVTVEAARRIVDQQVTRSERLAAADDVIANNGDFDALDEQVERLHRRYIALAGTAD